MKSLLYSRRALLRAGLTLKAGVVLALCFHVTPCGYSQGARLFKSGPIQSSADGAWVWVANPDHDSVARIDTSNDTVTEFVLPDPATKDAPRGLSVKEDGSEVWVACHDSDRVYVLQGADGSVLAQIDLPWGSGPFSIALSRDQSRALVTLHRSASLAVLDVATRKLAHLLKPVYWSPMGIAWTQDGSTAIVTHLYAEGEHPYLTRVDVSGAEPKVRTRITIFATDPRNSTALAAPYNIAEGGYLTTRGHPAQIPSATGRNEVWLPTQYNNINDTVYTPDSTVQSTVRHLKLDTMTVPNGVADKVILTALHVHDPANGNPYLGPGWNAHVAGPADIAFSANGAVTYVLHELSNDLLVMPSNTPLVRPAGAPPLPEIPVGNRPIGLTVSATANRAYVYNLLSRDVSVIDLTAMIELKRIPVTPTTGEPLAAEVLAGAKLFHTSDDPRISVNSKVSCASCHINAEHDGRTWAFHRLPGPHGPRDVPSMLGLGATFGGRDPVTGLGQLHRSGDRDEVQDFEHTFRSVNMGGTGFLGPSIQPELGLSNAGINPDLDALATYLLALPPIRRSPYRDPSGALSQAATRGATFFIGGNRGSKPADAGCAACHVPETGFVDFKFHDVGSTRPANEEELNTRAPLWNVNTPTLIGAWTTPPYNGVASFAVSIADVIRDQAARVGAANRHGTPDGLTRRQKRDLEAFVLSVDGNMSAAEVRAARDTSPPRLVRVAPTSLNRIEVWFSESIKANPATNPAIWRVSRPVAGDVVPVSLVVWDGLNGDHLTLTVPLQPNTAYRVHPLGSILDQADMASGGAANVLDATDPANTVDVSVGSSLTITLGASGYENITIAVHDTAMAGPNLTTWSHDSVWLFPVSGTPKVNTGFVRFDWRALFAQITGTSRAQDILDAQFSLDGQRGEAATIELRRVLLSWSDPATGGDYNQNAVNAPTWRDHAHPNGRWNSAGAGRLGSNGDQVADYNGLNDLATRIDANLRLEAINEEVSFGGPLVTDAFRFWFDHPEVDYGYALRLSSAATQEMRFERNEADWQDHGPVLSLTYALPVPPRLDTPVIQLGGAVQFVLHGETGRTYTVEASDNFTVWTQVTNATLSVDSLLVNDLEGVAGHRQRFYRARTP